MNKGERLMRQIKRNRAAEKQEKLAKDLQYATDMFHSELENSQELHSELYMLKRLVVAQSEYLQYINKDK